MAGHLNSQHGVRHHRNKTILSGTETLTKGNLSGEGYAGVNPMNMTTIVDGKY